MQRINPLPVTLGVRKYFHVNIEFSDGEMRCFQYIALPFGWVRYGYWLCRLVEWFWTVVRQRSHYRVLYYAGDFCIVSSMGRDATSNDHVAATKKLDRLSVPLWGATPPDERGIGHWHTSFGAPRVWYRYGPWDI